MFKSGTHICDELKNSEMKIKKLGLNERKEVLDSVLKKYIDINKKGAWIWEKFIHYKTLNDDMAWSYIKDFVKHNECVMFFNQAEEKDKDTFNSEPERSKPPFEPLIGVWEVL